MDEAIKAFSDAIEAEPNNSAGYVNRGVVYTSQQKYDKAIEDLDKAIKLNPKTFRPTVFAPSLTCRRRTTKRQSKITMSS